MKRSLASTCTSHQWHHPLPVKPDGQTAVFDEADFLKRNGGDLELARDIARLFAARAPDYLEIIESSLMTGDNQAFLHQAHSLKGAAATVGAGRLSLLAADLERLAKESRLDEAGQAVLQLKDELQAVIGCFNQNGWLD